MSERRFFAGKLKALREQAGLSQPVLAERSGVGVSTIRQFEYGRREPTYGTLVKLARGLDVSLAAFEPMGRSATTDKSRGRPPKPSLPPAVPPVGELDEVRVTRPAKRKKAARKETR